MTAIDTLTSLGFTEQDPAVFATFSEALGLSHNGDHKVLAYYSNGDVHAVMEQNISPDTSGGVEIITKHPAVLIVEGPRGRITIANANDDDAAAGIAHAVRSVG